MSLSKKHHVDFRMSLYRNAMLLQNVVLILGTQGKPLVDSSRTKNVNVTENLICDFNLTKSCEFRVFYS